MAFNIVDRIRERSREEWAEFLRERVIMGRIWLQEHPELGALYSVILGVFIALFFKLFFIVAALAVACALFIWLVAISENEALDPDKTHFHSSNGHSHNGSPPGKTNETAGSSRFEARSSEQGDKSDQGSSDIKGSSES